MKILIADHSKAMQKILANSMVSLGYLHDNFFYADNQVTALDIIGTKHPELTLCEANMPGAASLEFLQSIRDKDDSAKVVLVSNTDDTQLKNKVSEFKEYGFLKKPFTAAQLFSVVSEVLEGETIKKENISKSRYYWAVPAINSLEKVFSSLANFPVTFTPITYPQVDFSLAPFYGATMIDKDDNLVLGVFLDAPAANLVAALLKFHSLADAADYISKETSDEFIKQAVSNFIGMLTGMFRPLNSEYLMTLHADQYAEDATRHLKPHMDVAKDDSLVWRIGAGDFSGNILLVKSPTIN